MSRFLSIKRSKSFWYSLAGLLAVTAGFAVYARAATITSRPDVPPDLAAVLEQAQAAGIRSGAMRATARGSQPLPDIVANSWNSYIKCNASQGQGDYIIGFFSNGDYAYTSYIGMGNVLAQACASGHFLQIYFTSSTTWSDVYYYN